MCMVVIECMLEIVLRLGILLVDHSYVTGMNINYKMSVPHILQKKKQNKTTTEGCYYYLSL